MNCENILKKGFVACCCLAALTGIINGISCETRSKSDCSQAWDSGAQRALGAAGAIATALANFKSSNGTPPSNIP